MLIINFQTKNGAGELASRCFHSLLCQVHPESSAPDAEVASLDGEAKASDVNVEAGERGDPAEQEGKQSPGTESRGTGATTPFTGRPRPDYPVERFPLDDERRPPRAPPVDAVPLEEWSDSVYEEDPTLTLTLTPTLVSALTLNLTSMGGSDDLGLQLRGDQRTLCQVQSL